MLFIQTEFFKVFQILLLNASMMQDEQHVQILRNTAHLFSRQWSLYSSSTFLNIVTANRPLSVSSVRSLKQQSTMMHPRWSRSVWPPTYNSSLTAMPRM